MNAATRPRKPTQGSRDLDAAIRPRFKVAELAAVAGVNPETIRRWADGVGQPSPAQAAKLAAAGVSTLEAWATDSDEIAREDDGEE